MSIFNTRERNRTSWFITNDHLYSSLVLHEINYMDENFLSQWSHGMLIWYYWSGVDELIKKGNFRLQRLMINWGKWRSVEKRRCVANGGKELCEKLLTVGLSMAQEYLSWLWWCCIVSREGYLVDRVDRDTYRFLGSLQLIVTGTE